MKGSRHDPPSYYKLASLCLDSSIVDQSFNDIKVPKTLESNVQSAYREFGYRCKCRDIPTTYQSLDFTVFQNVSIIR